MRNWEIKNIKNKNNNTPVQCEVSPVLIIEHPKEVSSALVIEV